MTRSASRSLFFSVIGAGSVGMLVLAVVAFRPLWLRHQAVTKLVAAVRVEHSENASFWRSIPVSANVYDEISDLSGLFARVRELDGVEDATDRLTRLLDAREDVDVRLRAIHALHTLGGNRTVAVSSLDQALSEPVLRSAAAELLEEIGPAAKPAFPSLLAALRSEQERDHVRRYLIHAMRAIDPDGAAEALEFSPTLQLMNSASSGPNVGDADPVSLVRAVNHLRSLGKAKAIAALREYVDLAFISNPPERRRSGGADIDQSSQQVLALIVPLVFERIDTNGEPMESLWFEARKAPLAEDGRAGFLVIVEGDFCLQAVKIRTSFRSMKFLVDWAAEHGKFRERSLRMIDNPMAEAERVIELAVKRESAREDLQDVTPSDLAAFLNDVLVSIRMPAWKSVRRLLPSGDSARESAPLNEAAWRNFVLRMSRFRIRWDADRQDYVASAIASGDEGASTGDPTR